MSAEHSRIAFVEQRDGKEAAIAFAKQTYRIYRTAVLSSRKRKATKVHFASLPEYKRSFIESCTVFRQYLGSDRD